MVRSHREGRPHGTDPRQPPVRHDHERSTAPPLVTRPSGRSTRFSAQTAQGSHKKRPVDLRGTDYGKTGAGADLFALLFMFSVGLALLGFVIVIIGAVTRRGR